MSDEDLAEWADIQNEGDKGLPSDVAHLIIDGMNPIKAIRKWRGYKQCELAKLATISGAPVTSKVTGIFSRPFNGSLLLIPISALYVPPNNSSASK